MRIVAGRKKGMKLEAPAGEEITRPTSDRVKEAVFGSIQNQVADSCVLDLFAGSGALGIEAISRGAKNCVFIEKNKEPFEILKKNLAKAGFLKEATVYQLDYEAAFSRLRGPFDLVFLDPPYRGGMYEKALGSLLEYGLLKEESAVILECLTGMEIPIPKGFETVKTKKYGKTSVMFLRLEQQE